MKIAAPELPLIYLQPGELIITSQETVIVTVLGSCVAVTFFDRRLRMAAICHAMLARPNGTRALASEPEQPFKYLTGAISHIANEFVRLGCRPAEVEVKIFGGGNVIGGPAGETSRDHLGTINIRTARELLEAASFTINASNVGGERGRKILFDTSTGKVLHKHLPGRNEEPAS